MIYFVSFLAGIVIITVAYVVGILWKIKILQNMIAQLELECMRLDRKIEMITTQVIPRLVRVEREVFPFEKVEEDQPSKPE